jgi:hypothetical protein
MRAKTRAKLKLSSISVFFVQTRYSAPRARCGLRMIARRVGNSVAINTVIPTIEPAAAKASGSDDAMP